MPKVPKNKWISGFLPMIFMSFSTGSVYCWTLFREDIEKLHPHFTPQILTLCFMLALFFLGITAAFGGKLVERSVKRASLYTFAFFTAGWVLTGIGVHIGSVPLTIIGFGPIQGVGLGLGYLTPVKTLMMWFDGKKGFAAGLAIAAFGLAGLVGNPIIGWLLSNFSVYVTLYILTALYGVLCFIAYITIDRPPLKQCDAELKTYKITEVIFSRKFIFLWIVLFLNIASGLALISHEQQVYIMLGLNAEANRALIVLFCTLTAGSNLVGRIITASSQDKTDKKHLPYYVMTLASIAMCLIAFLIMPPILAVGFITVIVIQFFFGCGFACLPNILDQNYGMKQLATIQGLMLTAWAVAALVGPQIASSILVLANPETGAPANLTTLTTLYIVLAAMFVVQLVFLLLFVMACKRDKRQNEMAPQAV